MKKTIDEKEDHKQQQMKQNVTNEKIRSTMTKFKKPSREAQKQTHDQHTKEKGFQQNYKGIDSEDRTSFLLC